MPVLHVNGCDLYYQDTGRTQTGEPVLFLHGLFVDHRIFSAQLEALSPDRRCLSMDLRNHGQSDTPTGQPPTLPNLADDAVELAHTLYGGAVHLVGHGLGAHVAAYAAKRHPERALSLALLSFSPAYLRSHRLGLHLTSIAARSPLSSLLGRTLATQMFGPTYLAHPKRSPERDRWLSGDIRLTPSIGETVRATLSARTPTSDLSALEQPILVMYGTEDRLLPRQALERARTDLPEARFLPIPNAGHLPSIEQPAAVTSALVAFFAHVEGKSSTSIRPTVPPVA